LTRTSTVHELPADPGIVLGVYLDVLAAGTVRVSDAIKVQQVG
jgi:MOSC domain-containing protein YiiM